MEKGIQDGVGACFIFFHFVVKMKTSHAPVSFFHASEVSVDMVNVVQISHSFSKLDSFNGRQ